MKSCASLFPPTNLAQTILLPVMLAITSCEALVARTGSIVLSAHNSGRITSVYAPVIFALPILLNWCMILKMRWMH